MTASAKRAVQKRNSSNFLSFVLSSNSTIYLFSGGANFPQTIPFLFLVLSTIAYIVKPVKCYFATTMEKMLQPWKQKLLFCIPCISNQGYTYCITASGTEPEAWESIWTAAESNIKCKLKYTFYSVQFSVFFLAIEKSLQC